MCGPSGSSSSSRVQEANKIPTLLNGRARQNNEQAVNENGRAMGDVGGGVTPRTIASASGSTSANGSVTTKAASIAADGGNSRLSGADVRSPVFNASVAQDDTGFAVGATKKNTKRKSIVGLDL